MATFKRIRVVNLPVLKMIPGKPRYFFFLGPMTVGKKIDDQKDPATLIHAVDMETGEEGQFIATTVVQKELRDNYPGDGYVNRGFEIVHTRVPEKKYVIPSISEVAVPDEAQEAVQAAMKSAAAAREAVAATPAADPKAPAAKSAGKR